MITAAFKALGDMFSADFRSVLWKAFGLALLLFVLVLVVVQVFFRFVTLFPSPWIQNLADILASFGLIVAFFFLMAPVTSLFAGLYLDKIASLVESMHYPADIKGEPQSAMTSMITSVQFAGLVLITNILALPLVFTGFGVFVLLAINAYLLSREYFEMIAMRYMPVAEAKELRKRHGAELFIAGIVPAVLAIIPFVNLLVPLFSTSYFLHYFKQVRRS